MTTEIMRLSPSIARTLLNRSPLHAWTEHRLGGNKRKEETAEMGEGKLIEAILFGLPLDNLMILPFDSYRTKEAQQAKALGQAEGKSPILAHVYAEAEAAAEPVQAALRSKGIDLSEGEKQVRLEWQSLNPQAPGNGVGVACSGVLDQLVLDESKRRCVIRDLKTTDNAHPRVIQRKILDMGYELQYAAYEEAVNTKYPWTAGVTEFQLVYVERDAPHAVTVVELSGSMRELGTARWRRAVETWGRSLATKRWADYSSIPVRVEALPWQLNQEAESELNDLEARRADEA